MAGPEPKLLSVAGDGQWEAWLAENAEATTEGVWLRMPNKGATQPGPTYVGAVEAALCFGWIDGQVRRNDDGESHLQRFTPRRKRSLWSKINVERVERLIAEGRMRPAGHAEIERAKADGRWAQAYDPPSTAEIPADFLAELDKHPKAKEFFATLTKSATFPIAHRLQTASKPETRANRLAVLIGMLERGEKP